MHEIASRPEFPCEKTIYRKMAKDPVFAAAINQARTAQQEYEADQTVKMADEATVDDYNVVKLRIWARQWRAAKLAPKKYGDRLNVDADIRSTVSFVINGAPDEPRLVGSGSTAALEEE